MAVTTEQVAELYVAFFNRAPDAAGLAYWVNDSGLELEQISESFFNQEETTTAYPESLTDAVFVDTIYKNVFNRAADPDGLDYWVKELQSGSITKADMILAVVNGAQNTALGNDQTILNNKTEIGLYFAAKGQDDVTEAAEVMEGVDDTSASVTAAKDDIDSLNPLVLTTFKDTLEGTVGDDTITGLDTTYTPGDSIDGGEGNDTFNLKISAALAPDPFAQVKNVENINITTGAATTISAANWEGVETLTLLKSAAAGHTVSNLGVDLKSLVISGATAGETTAVTTSLYTGNDDTFHVAVDKAVSTTTIGLTVTDQAATPAGVVENFDIETKTTSATTTVVPNAVNTFAGTKITTAVTDTGLKTVTLHGTGGIEYAANAASTKLTTIDATELDGAFKYDGATIAAGVAQTIIGGNSNDVLTGGTVSDTFIGGKGADSITVGSGSDLVKILYKEDSGVTTATADKISAFAIGSDQINVVGLAAGSTSNYIAKSDATITSIELAVAEANKGDIVGKEFISYGNGTDTYLVYDMDNNGTVDGAMELTGLKGTTVANTLQATDII